MGEPRLDGVDRARLRRAAPGRRAGRARSCGTWRRAWRRAASPACRRPRRPASRGRGRRRDASRRAGRTSCTRWWLAEATRATSSSSGSHGRSVRARSTRTAPTVLSAGAPGCDSVNSTTSWPAAAERLAQPVDVGGDAADRPGRELPGQHQDPHRAHPNWRAFFGRFGGHPWRLKTLENRRSSGCQSGRRGRPRFGRS